MGEFPRILPAYVKKSPADASTWPAFVDEYMKDFSPTRAFLAVYHGTLTNAERAGERLIRRNTWVQQEIRRRSEGRITLADVTPERIKLELARMALFDPRKTVATRVDTDADGESTLKESAIPLAMLDEDTARAITGISYDVRGNRVLKTDKATALTALAKILIEPRLTTVDGRASAITHDAASEDEIMLMLQEFEDNPDDDEIDVGDEIEGEYADDTGDE